MSGDKLEDYELLSKIGSGTFGNVSKIREKSTGRTYVWKSLHYAGLTAMEKQRLVAEVNILSKLRSPNIVRYYNRIVDRASATLYIIMEFCPNGDLGALIKRAKASGQRVPEEVVWKVYSQLVLALRSCHTADHVILHRDIKPGNVFLDAQGNVKLGDFGLARVLGDDSVLAQTWAGTPFFMSPQQVDGLGYNEKSDVWSLGCLLYELCAFQPPFVAASQLQLAQKIKLGQFDRIPQEYSNDLQRLIERLLTQSQSRRPSSCELAGEWHVQLFMRESKLRAQYTALRTREKQLNVQQEALQAKENALNEQCQRLADKERRLNVLLARTEAEKNARSSARSPDWSSSSSSSSQSRSVGSSNVTNSPLSDLFSATTLSPSERRK